MDISLPGNNFNIDMKEPPSDGKSLEVEKSLNDELKEENKEKEERGGILKTETAPSVDINKYRVELLGADENSCWVFKESIKEEIGVNSSNPELVDEEEKFLIKFGDNYHTLSFSSKKNPSNGDEYYNPECINSFKKYIENPSDEKLQENFKMVKYRDGSIMISFTNQINENPNGSPFFQAISIPEDGLGGKDGSGNLVLERLTSIDLQEKFFDKNKKNKEDINEIKDNVLEEKEPYEKNFVVLDKENNVSVLRNSFHDQKEGKMYFLLRTEKGDRVLEFDSKKYKEDVRKLQRFIYNPENTDFDKLLLKSFDNTEFLYIAGIDNDNIAMKNVTGILDNKNPNNDIKYSSIDLENKDIVEQIKSGNV